MSRLSELMRTLGMLPPRRLDDLVADRKAPLVLHVGPHKTGSTSIQVFCEQNRQQLAEAGFWYPKAGILNSQHLVLPACYLGSHAIIPKSILGGCPKEIVASIAAEVPDGLTPLLSSEVFWELFCHEADAFQSALAVLGQRYRVVIAFVDRPVTERSWSAIKHLSRLGYAFDPVANFHVDQERQRRSMKRLAKMDCPVIRVPYDPANCISPFLDCLSSQLLSRPTVERPQLDALMQQCRDTSLNQRENTAPPDRWLVAFAMEFSRRLMVTRGEGSKVEDSVVAFLQQVLAIGNELESTRRLPDEDVVFRRALEANGSPGCLLMPSEVAAWESICKHPAVQLSAMRTGCVDELGAIRSQPRPQQRVAA